jgi:hypothetical protein
MMANGRLRNVERAIVPLLFLFISSHSAAQDPLEQFTVSLEINNRPLHLILDNLTDQTGFFFTYDSRLIDSEEKKSISVTNEKLNRVLDSLLPDTTFNYRIIRRNIVIYPEKTTLPGTVLPSEGGPLKYSFEGYVTDASGRRPMPYATVGIIGTRLGTITNTNGMFRLVLPDTIPSPILAVSYIGYKTAYYPVSAVSTETISIRLEKQYISLQEVIIRRQDPVKLISEAIRLIPDNYVDERSGAIGYYREKVERNDEIIAFSEAVVEMARPPYSATFLQDRIRLLKGRKISSASPRDTVLFRITSGVSSMLNLDIVHNLPDFLNEDFTRLYDFTFSDIVTYNDQLVYVIGFKPKEQVDQTLFRGEIYLDQESLAIVAADFEYDPSRIGIESDMFVARRSPFLRIRPVQASYEVDYNNHEGKYYLGQVQAYLEFKVRRKRQWIASRYAVRLELAVTQVKPGDPPDISYSEALKPRVILSQQEFEYDPDFWGSYNTIVAESGLKEALENIEESIQEITSREE